MKKVLIITYYWPPSGGSGVQRWLKFTKYLPEFGWQPYVFTPENPSFEVKDQSLEKDVPPEVEVIKLPIWEPYGIFEKFKDRGSQQSDLVKRGKKSLFSKVMLWVRGNFFIPDPRVFWVKPSVKVLEDLLASNGIDTIITTGPPHSIHLIGLKLKKKLGVKWLADFRDPWSTWELLDSFYLTGLAWHRHKKLEQKVVKTADAVVCVGRYHADELEKVGKRKVEVITNGFDEADFSSVPEDLTPKEFVIRHIGVVDELRDPRPCLEAIKRLAQEGIEIKIDFIGNVNETLKEEVRQDEILRRLVSFGAYVPHSEVLKLYRQSAVLLLVLANSKNAAGNITGKIFEYLASGTPIIAIGPVAGDAAAIIEQTRTGYTCEREDIEGIKETIRDLHNQFLRGERNEQHDIMQFSRRRLTEKLAGVLEKMRD